MIIKPGCLLIAALLLPYNASGQGRQEYRISFKQHAAFIPETCKAPLYAFISQHLTDTAKDLKIVVYGVSCHLNPYWHDYSGDRIHALCRQLEKMAPGFDRRRMIFCYDRRPGPDTMVLYWVPKGIPDESDHPSRRH